MVKFGCLVKQFFGVCSFRTFSAIKYNQSGLMSFLSTVCNLLSTILQRVTEAAHSRVMLGAAITRADLEPPSYRGGPEPARRRGQAYATSVHSRHYVKCTLRRTDDDMFINSSLPERLQIKPEPAKELTGVDWV